MAKKILKKKKTSKTSSKKGISQLADPVFDSAQNIWRAGLGAFAMAQQEGGKVVGQGSAMFEKLVAEGARLEAEGRKVVDQGTSAVRSKVSGMGEGVEQTLNEARKQAEDRWDKLETVFEDRVARVMASLGVPTGDELNRLSAQVEKLSGQVTALAKQPRSTAKAAAPKKAAPKKAAPKKAAPKKAAPKPPRKRRPRRQRPRRQRPRKRRLRRQPPRKRLPRRQPRKRRLQKRQHLKRQRHPLL